MNDRPSDEVMDRIDRICDEYEASWKNDNPLDVKELLGDWVGDDRQALLRELIGIDVHYRRAQGLSAGTDNYAGLCESESETAQLRGILDAAKVETLLLGADATGSGHKDGEASGLPREFGDYLLEEEVARGGMGVVFRARQRSLARQVAVKMIRSQQLASEEEVRRFYAEAQASANLDHPNIVPIIEVGERDGQHFFSMALVQGDSLADHLENGPMEPQAACEIMRDVALAVQHAHQHGVVHRDLKPANILLDRQSGQPRITDFGVAKKTQTDQQQTATGMVLGTPGFMPPEQARGQQARVGVSADVYSLGATLYCLITGRPPFQAASIIDTLRQVVDSDPVSPRQLNPAIPRDLDTVCLKCLRKESEQRYESAQQLADELDRFLAGKPIVARPLGRLSRLARWSKRHPLTTSLIAALVLVTAIGIGSSAWQYGKIVLAMEQVKSKSKLARNNLDRAMAAVDQMLTRLGTERLKHIPEFDKERRAILEDALALYQSLLDANSKEPQVRLETARAHVTIANLQMALGSFSEALKALDESANLLDGLVAEQGSSTELQYDLAQAEMTRGAVLRESGQHQQALQASQRATEILSVLNGTFPENVEYRKALVRATHNRALSQFTLGEFEDAVTLFRQSISFLEEEDTSALSIREPLAKSLMGLSLVYRELGSIKESEEALRRAIGIYEDLSNAAPLTPGFEHLLARAHGNLGEVLERGSRWPDAEAEYLKALDIASKLVAAHPAIPLYQNDLATYQHNLAEVYQKTGRTEQAIATHRDAIQTQRKLVDNYPATVEYSDDLATSHNSLGVIYRRLRKPQLAAKEYEKVITIRTRLARDNPRLPTFQENLAAIHNNIGNLHVDAKRFNLAEKSLRKAADIRLELTKKHPGNPNFRWRLARTYNNLGSLFLTSRQFEKSEPALARSIVVHEKLERDHPSLANAVDLAGTYANRGMLDLATAKPNASLEWFAKGIQICEQALRRDQRNVLARRRLFFCHFNRAQALDKLARHLQAIDDWDRVVKLDGTSNTYFTIRRALSRTRAKDHETAAAEVEALLSGGMVAGTTLYDAACVFSLATAAASADSHLPKAERNKLTEKYAVRAVGLLNKALQAGYFKDPANRRHFRTDSDLDSLRTRQDFKKLVSTVDEPNN